MGNTQHTGEEASIVILEYVHIEVIYACTHHFIRPVRVDDYTQLKMVDENNVLLEPTFYCPRCTATREAKALAKLERSRGL